MDNKVVIHLPPVSHGYVAQSLRELTRALQTVTGEGPHGLLGGEFGYGCEYENNVFMMHPFCWCEEPDCRWCRSCYCTIEERGSEWITITKCGNCVEQPARAPNFLYKPTGAKVEWYKYIGRSMKIEGDLPNNFLVKCLESLQ